MPCYRCGARQIDPSKGASPWKRGVRGGVQVLVCPACQRRNDWMTDLERCPECGSTMLVRALGETHCRACGESWAQDEAHRDQLLGTPAAGLDGRPVSHGIDDLADEVNAALDRFFGRA